jgi:hypothetical protein
LLLQQKCREKSTKNLKEKFGREGVDNFLRESSLFFLAHPVHHKNAKNIPKLTTTFCFKRLKHIHLESSTQPNTEQ